MKAHIIKLLKDGNKDENTDDLDNKLSYNHNFKFMKKDDKLCDYVSSGPSKFKQVQILFDHFDGHSPQYVHEVKDNWVRKQMMY